MTDQEKTKILFICLGNICRSPMAEAVFRHIANEKSVGDQFIIRSAAIGPWHVGGKGDKRMLNVLKSNNIEFKHKVTQICLDDYNEYDYIFGMDEDNMRHLNKQAPKGSKAKLELFGIYDDQGEKIIRDPYYDDDIKGFEKCYEQCVRCTHGFLEKYSQQ